MEAHTEAGAAQLAGNSVHVDAAFLRRWMPRLAAHLHYRIVDVSTVMELCRRWFPKAYRCAPRKKVRRPWNLLLLKLRCKVPTIMDLW